MSKLIKRGALAAGIVAGLFVLVFLAGYILAGARLNKVYDLPEETVPIPVGEAALERGMPLGLLPGMTYEEAEATLAPGESLLLYSDGLLEAHNSRREMFGGPRLRAFHSGIPVFDSEVMIDLLLNALVAHVGEGWEQEDDVTLVSLSRAGNVTA